MHKKTTNWGILVVVVKWHHHTIDLFILILVLIFLGQFCPRDGKGAVGLTLCEAPTCETRPDHYTGNSVPYSWWRLRGFFNIPCWLDTEDAGDRAYNLSPLSKKTRTSPAWQSGALPTELTGCGMTWHHAIVLLNLTWVLTFRPKSNLEGFVWSHQSINGLICQRQFAPKC